MSCKLRQYSGAFCLAIAFAMGVLCAPGRAMADADDHSYLPPWMLTETGAVRKAGDKPVQPAMAGVKAAQPAKAQAKAEAELAKAEEPEAPGLTARAMAMKTKAVGFVSGIFQSSLRYAAGE